MNSGSPISSIYEEVNDLVALHGRNGANMESVFSELRVPSIYRIPIMKVAASAGKIALYIRKQETDPPEEISAQHVETVEDLRLVTGIAPICSSWRAYGFDSHYDIPEEASGHQDVQMSILALVGKARKKGVTISEATVELQSGKLHTYVDRLVATGLIVKRIIQPQFGRLSESRCTSRTNILHLARFAADYDPNEDFCIFEGDEDMQKKVVDFVRNILRERKEPFIAVTELAQILNVPRRTVNLSLRNVLGSSSPRLKMTEVFLSIRGDRSSQRLAIGFDETDPANAEHVEKIESIAALTRMMSEQPAKFRRASGKDWLPAAPLVSSDVTSRVVEVDNTDTPSQAQASNERSGVSMNLTFYENMDMYIHRGTVAGGGAAAHDLRDTLGISYKKIARVGAELTTDLQYPTVKKQTGKNVTTVFFDKPNDDEVDADVQASSTAAALVAIPSRATSAKCRRVTTVNGAGAEEAMAVDDVDDDSDYEDKAVTKKSRKQSSGLQKAHIAHARTASVRTKEENREGAGITKISSKRGGRPRKISQSVSQGQARAEADDEDEEGEADNMEDSRVEAVPSVGARVAIAADEGYADDGDEDYRHTLRSQKKRTHRGAAKEATTGDYGNVTIKEEASPATPSALRRTRSSDAKSSAAKEEASPATPSALQRRKSGRRTAGGKRYQSHASDEESDDVSSDSNNDDDDEEYEEASHKTSPAPAAAGARKGKVQTLSRNSTTAATATSILSNKSTLVGVTEVSTGSVDVGATIKLENNPKLSASSKKKVAAAMTEKSKWGAMTETRTARLNRILDLLRKSGGLLAQTELVHSMRREEEATGITYSVDRKTVFRYIDQLQEEGKIIQIQAEMPQDCQVSITWKLHGVDGTDEIESRPTAFLRRTNARDVTRGKQTGTLTMIAICDDSFGNPETLAKNFMENLLKDFREYSENDRLRRAAPKIIKTETTANRSSGSSSNKKKKEQKGRGARTQHSDSGEDDGDGDGDDDEVDRDEDDVVGGDRTLPVNSAIPVVCRGKLGRPANENNVSVQSLIGITEDGDGGDDDEGVGAVDENAGNAGNAVRRPTTQLYQVLRRKRGSLATIQRAGMAFDSDKTIDMGLAYRIGNRRRLGLPAGQDAAELNAWMYNDPITEMIKEYLKSISAADTAAASPAASAKKQRQAPRRKQQNDVCAVPQSKQQARQSLLESLLALRPAGLLSSAMRLHLLLSQSLAKDVIVTKTKSKRPLYVFVPEKFVGELKLEDILKMFYMPGYVYALIIKECSAFREDSNTECSASLQHFLDAVVNGDSLDSLLKIEPTLANEIRSCILPQLAHKLFTLIGFGIIIFQRKNSKLRVSRPASGDIIELESILSNENLLEYTNNLKEFLYVRRRARFGFARVAYNVRTFCSSPAGRIALRGKSMPRTSSSSSASTSASSSVEDLDAYLKVLDPTEHAEDGRSTTQLETVVSNASDVVTPDNAPAGATATAAATAAESTIASAVSPKDSSGSDFETRAKILRQDVEYLDRLRRHAMLKICRESCEFSLTPPSSRLQHVRKPEDILEYWDSAILPAIACPENTYELELECVDFEFMGRSWKPGDRFWKGILLPSDAFEGPQVDEGFREAIMGEYERNPTAFAASANMNYLQSGVKALSIAKKPCNVQAIKRAHFTSNLKSKKRPAQNAGAAGGHAVGSGDVDQSSTQKVMRGEDEWAPEQFAMAMQWTLGELLVSTREFVSTPLVPFYKLLKYTDLVDDRYYHPALMLHTMDIPSMPIARSRRSNMLQSPVPGKSAIQTQRQLRAVGIQAQTAPFDAWTIRRVVAFLLANLPTDFRLERVQGSNKSRKKHRQLTKGEECEQVASTDASTGIGSAVGPLLKRANTFDSELLRVLNCILDTSAMMSRRTDFSMGRVAACNSVLRNVEKLTSLAAAAGYHIPSSSASTSSSSSSSSSSASASAGATSVPALSATGDDSSSSNTSGANDVVADPRTLHLLPVPYLSADAQSLITTVQKLAVHAAQPRVLASLSDQELSRLAHTYPLGLAVQADSLDSAAMRRAMQSYCDFDEKRRQRALTTLYQFPPLSVARAQRDLTVSDWIVYTEKRQNSDQKVYVLSNNFFSTFRTHMHRSFEMLMDEDHVDKAVAAYKSQDASNTITGAGAADAGLGTHAKGGDATAAAVAGSEEAQIGSRSRGSRKRGRSTDALESAPTSGIEVQSKKRTLSLLHRAVSTVDPSVVGDSTAISQSSAITPHEALMFAYALSFSGNILGGTITVSANAFADDEEDEEDQRQHQQQGRQSRGAPKVKGPPRAHSLRHNLRGEADAPSVTVKFGDTCADASSNKPGASAGSKPVSSKIVGISRKGHQKLSLNRLYCELSLFQPQDKFTGTSTPDQTMSSSPAAFIMPSAPSTSKITDGSLSQEHEAHSNVVPLEHHEMEKAAKEKEKNTIDGGPVRLSRRRSREEHSSAEEHVVTESSTRGCKAAKTSAAATDPSPVDALSPSPLPDHSAVASSSTLSEDLLKEVRAWMLQEIRTAGMHGIAVALIYDRWQQREKQHSMISSASVDVSTATEARSPDKSSNSRSAKTRLKRQTSKSSEAGSPSPSLSRESSLSSPPPRVVLLSHVCELAKEMDSRGEALLVKDVGGLATEDTSNFTANTNDCNDLLVDAAFAHLYGAWGSGGFSAARKSRDWNLIPGEESCPWITIDGSINRRLYTTLRGKIAVTLNDRPGATVQALQKVLPQLSAHQIEVLAQTMVRDGLVNVMKSRSSLLQPRGPFDPEPFSSDASLTAQLAHSSSRMISSYFLNTSR